MNIGLHPRRGSLRVFGIAVLAAGALDDPATAPRAWRKSKAKRAAGAIPPWNKGILPISPESYYNAIECGKQGGADPPCVFWDTGLCKNDDFALAMYTPYKQVAYEVWVAVNKKQPAPQPNYPAAQRTRITIGVTQEKTSKNALTDLVVRRGGRPLAAVDRSLSGGGGRFTFDFPAFAVDAAKPERRHGLIWWARRRPISCDDRRGGAPAVPVTASAFDSAKQVSEAHREPRQKRCRQCLVQRGADFVGLRQMSRRRTGGTL